MKTFSTKIRLVLLSSIVLFYSGCGKADPVGASEAISPIDFAAVGDGVWTGSWDGVTLSVTVASHRVVDITFSEHNWSAVGRRAQYITHSIIGEQSLNVDVVAGATLSSRDILKAVEIALEKGVQ